MKTKGVGAGNCPHFIMAELKIIEGTYGFASVIYDTTLYNYLMTITTGDKTVYQNGNYTTIGLEFYQALGSYVNTVKTTMLHNLTTGDTFNVEVCVDQMKRFFQGTTYTDLFVRDVMSETFNSRTTSMIRLTPSGSAIYTAISTDGVTWNGQQAYYPYGNISVATSQRYANSFINIQVYNDDGSSGTAIELQAVSDIGLITLRRKNFTVEWSRLFPEWINGINPWSDTEDPFNPGGNTDPSPKPPSGDFDNTSDPIAVSQLPTLSAVDTRFISLFKPDLTQLQSLASYMWGANFDLETFKKLFNDPMAAILGLSIVPVDPPAAAAAPITLGNITTTISMPKITSQYVQVQCGTLNVNEYWGAYLDYSPFTKLEIYLPYIGVQTLDADDIMGRSVEVVYNIDVLSGACVAQLKCGDSVLYSFAGSCAVSIPITGRDWTNMINGIIGVATAAAGIAVAGATGGASVAAAAAGGALSQTANSLSSMKPTVQKSGTMAAGSGMLAIQKPYLILTRPRQALPENQNKYTGYPSFITATLGDLTGMTYVYEIHLENVDCTQAEQTEIETLLKNGVIL